MILLHIASLNNNPFKGVSVAVPQHIIHQQSKVDVALLNIQDCYIEGIHNQFVLKSKEWRESVPESFQYPDLVIFHEVYHFEFVKIAKTLQQDDTPYIIIPHGCLVRSAQQKKKWKKLIANTFLFNAFIHKCKALQCLSENELDNIEFNVPKFISTNGVSIPERHKEGFNDDRLYIIFIGRLEIVPKGLDLLLQAIKQVVKYPEFVNHITKIDLFGPDFKGRYNEVQSLITSNGVDSIVKLHHEVMGEEKRELLLTADIFIQTSRHEGMPMGILEAMSYGIPCIITEGTSLGKITEQYDAGWVSKTSIDSIAETIMRSIKERNKLKKKSTNAIKLIEENFSWDRLAQEAIKIYSSFLH